MTLIPSPANPSMSPGPPGPQVPPFLSACRGLPAPRTPVWLLRQAGRYLPEYRALRERHDFLSMLRTPELAAEATLQPLRRFPLDAAILFSDLATPLEALGLGLRFAPGPVLERPVRSAAAIDALRVPPPDELERALPHGPAAVRAVRGELPADVPLICFAGAPFTLFCYVVEGGGAGDPPFPAALELLRREPEAGRRLLDKLAELALSWLELQARAGAQALMLFDTWGGLLSVEEYRDFALPGARRILAGVERFELPRIYFVRSRPPAPDASAWLREAARLPVEVVGVDERTPLSTAREILGPRIAVQGNLAPAALHASPDELERAIDRVLADAGGAPGHLFNLGHGVEPGTDPASVARLVERVHLRTADARRGDAT